MSANNWEITRKRSHCTRRYWRRVLREGLESGLKYKLDIEKLRKKRHYGENKQLKSTSRGETMLKVIQG